MKVGSREWIYCFIGIALSGLPFDGLEDGVVLMLFGAFGRWQVAPV
jgi:hypothetical protein